MLGLVIALIDLLLKNMYNIECFDLRYADKYSISLSQDGLITRHVSSCMIKGDLCQIRVSNM